eukprot:1678840-Alexandrium_andersonii.AAC.1
MSRARPGASSRLALMSFTKPLRMSTCRAAVSSRATSTGSFCKSFTSRWRTCVSEFEIASFTTTFSSPAL